MPEKWREKIAFKSSGGEKMLHILNVDDVLLDIRDWEQPRGEGETERGDWSRFFREKCRMKTHLKGSTAARLTAQTRLGWTKNEHATCNLHKGSQRGESRLKPAHSALNAERRNRSLSPANIHQIQWTAVDRAEGLRQWVAGQWYDCYAPRVTSTPIMGLRVFLA